jgi:hypothetical protein
MSGEDAEGSGFELRSGNLTKKKQSVAVSFVLVKYYDKSLT